MTQKRNMWFGLNSEGYEELSLPYESQKVTVHQLTAIADGADPRKVFSNGEYVTHHKKEIPWLNTPENLKVVTKEEHNLIHKPREIITEKECEKIRSSEKNISELANEFGVSNGAIAKHIYGDCTHFEGAAREKRKGPRDGPWRDKSTFYNLYVNKDKTLEEVADTLGCSTSTASNWRRKHGIEK